MNEETLRWIMWVGGALLFFGLVGGLQARVKRRGGLNAMVASNRRWVTPLVIGVIALGLLGGAAYIVSMVGNDWALGFIERVVDGMRTDTAQWIMGITAVALVLWMIGLHEDRKELRYSEKELRSLYPSGVMGEGERAWLVDDELGLAQTRQRRKRREVYVQVALFVVVCVVVDDAVSFFATFWQPILLFAIGTFGLVRAKQLVDRYNTWDAPYAFSILSGFGGFILGVIKLVQIL